MMRLRPQPAQGGFDPIFSGHVIIFLGQLAFAQPVGCQSLKVAVILGAGPDIGLKRGEWIAMRVKMVKRSCPPFK